MAEITWIKLRTNMFDDEKIKLIERLPEGDGVLVVWIKLLAHAGKSNCNGYIMISENIPMNVEEVSAIFNRPFEKVKYAISVLQRYKMIDVTENDIICITNWEKHQNIEGMDKIRLQNRERKRLERERKKTLLLEDSIKEDGHVTVTGNHATEEELELEKEKDIKPSSHKFSTFDVEASERLFELMKINNPGVKEPNIEKWANEVRLMRERDKRTEDQIMYLIEWTQSDSFWKSNILSIDKLRKQFDSLVVKIKAQKESKQYTNGNRYNPYAALQNEFNHYKEDKLNENDNATDRLAIPENVDTLF